MDRRWDCGLATGVPPSFCLSRCFSEAQGTSLGDERISVSVTELTERMKWIWLETGQGGAGKTFKHLWETRVRKQIYRVESAWLLTGVQGNHVALTEDDKRTAIKMQKPHWRQSARMHQQETNGLISYAFLKILISGSRCPGTYEVRPAWQTFLIGGAPTGFLSPPTIQKKKIPTCDRLGFTLPNK